MIYITFLDPSTSSGQATEKLSRSFDYAQDNKSGQAPEHSLKNNCYNFVAFHYDKITRSMTRSNRFCHLTLHYTKLLNAILFM